MPTFNKTDQQEPVMRGMTKNDLALLSNGVGFVIKDHRKRVSKNRRSFLKPDPVFVKIARCLVLVPFNLQAYSTVL